MEDNSFEKTETQDNTSWVDVGSTTYYMDDDMVDTPPTENEVPDDVLQYRGKPYKDLTLEDLKDVAFGSIEEVDQFYSYYSLAKGFSMRKNKLDKNRAGTVVTRRQLVCSREGQRRESGCVDSDNEEQQPTPSDEVIVQRGWRNEDRPNEMNSGIKRNIGSNKDKKERKQSRRITRGNCLASLTVRLCTKRNVYYATEFVTEHNHVLVRPEHRHFMRSHRKVSESDVATVSSIKGVSVKTSRAYEFLVHQAGGYPFVGFTLKDLYNKLHCEKAEALMDGDAQSSVTWMNMKALMDPHFYCIFSVDENGRLANMFWRDGQSLVDYNNFGDILIFDATYKSNVYGKPLAVFVGCNNHRATVLFGCALLTDEKEETYLCVLNYFLNSMYGKMPTSVITDGDDAMRNAVTRLIPGARHRLCAWHIGKNVCSNLKGIDVQRDFFHLIFAGLTVDEWEAGWQYFVSMNHLENNKWVASMYNKRERWAEAFFRDNFFGGICSTQRCEGMHRNLKGGIGRYMQLFEVLPRMERTIARIRNRAAEDDYRSEQCQPVLGRHMRCLQEEVGKKFTHDIFLLVKDQINYEKKFVVIHRDENPTSGSKVLSLTQYGKPERRWTVWYQPDKQNPTFVCSCKLFQSDGIPCCHIFAVMKFEMITSFPDSLVNKRWTKEASSKKKVPNIANASDKSVQVARYGELMSICAKICHTSSCTDHLYDKTREALLLLSMETKQNEESSEGQPGLKAKDGLHPNVIRDPIVCRTKGSKNRQETGNEYENEQQKGVIKCSMCGRTGHNRRTCDLAKPVNDQSSDATGNNTLSSTDHLQSSRLYCDDATPTHSPTITESSDDDDEVEPRKYHQSTHLMHHNEEVRAFDFFGGYDTSVSSRPSLFDLFSPFPSSSSGMS